MALSGPPAFPLRKGGNAKSDAKRNVQKWINYQLSLLAKADKAGVPASIAEDGQWGEGTDKALFIVVYRYKNKRYPTAAEIAATKAPRGEVGQVWYNQMLADLRAAKWTPYGEQVTNASTQNTPVTNPSTTANTTTTTPQATGGQPSKNTYGFIWGSALALTAGYALSGKDGKPGKRALRIAPLTIGGAVVATGYVAAMGYRSKWQREKAALEAAIAYEEARGDKRQQADSTYSQWATAIERAIQDLFGAGAPVVLGIIYKIRTRSDYYALQLAYGQRARVAPAGALFNPVSTLQNMLLFKKQNLTEVLSMFPAAEKKEANRHLSQIFNVPPIP